MVYHTFKKDFDVALLNYLTYDYKFQRMKKGYLHQKHIRKMFPKHRLMLINIDPCFFLILFK